MACFFFWGLAAAVVVSMAGVQVVVLGPNMHFSVCKIMMKILTLNSV